MKEPLSPDAATALIHAIARDGTVSWSDHGKEEMAADSLTTLDCMNVLRAGAVKEPAGLEKALGGTASTPIDCASSSRSGLRPS